MATLQLFRIDNGTGVMVQVLCLILFRGRLQLLTNRIYTLIRGIQF